MVADFSLLFCVVVGGSNDVPLHESPGWRDLAHNSFLIPTASVAKSQRTEHLILGFLAAGDGVDNNSEGDFLPLGRQNTQASGQKGSNG